MVEFNLQVAEREGFEPSVPVRGQRFSRPPRSTTPASLQTFDIKYQKVIPKVQKCTFTKAYICWNLLVKYLKLN